MKPEPPLRVLGRYVLYGEIAAGGMATVHIGRLLGQGGFARTIAIKRLHPHFARDPEFVAMFLDEARLAARVHHPNVVPTLDVVAQDGEVFLVMEYVEGESLARLVRASKRKGGPPPVAIACAILAGALRGLHAAHEAKGDDGRPLGLVHRDVSPHNVLVGTDGLPRVLDFGVAKAIGRAQITREGQLKGKIPYMAPEQIRRGGRVTRRTDVYASSVVLWEALVAKRLFDADDEAQVMSAILDPHVDPPSHYEPKVPKELDAIVVKGLSVDPEARFSTALEMAEAIESAVPMATTSELGAWVSSLAEESLDQRARWVAAVESSGSVPAMIAAAPATDAANEPATQASNVSMTTSTERRAARRSTIAIVASFAVATAAAVVAWIAWPSHRTEPPTPTASATSAATSTPTTTSSSTSAASTSASTTSATSKAPPKTKPTTKPPSTNSPEKQLAPCDPPFFYKNGIKTFKPECL